MSSYRGRPSKGCDPCRAKKVKCDEGKPVCIRCSKSGHACKYRDQADLLFRNQTAFAAQKAEESWRKRSKSHQRNHSESAISSAHATPSTRRSNSIHSSINFPSQHHEASAYSKTFNEILTSPVSYDLRRLAYDRFVYDFVIPETPNPSCDEPSDAMWDFIPYLYEKAGTGSCLVTIVDAISYTNFANRFNAPQARPLAEECATKSIKLLQTTIADKTLASSNDALCAVHFMGMLGKMLLHPQATVGTFQAHERGARALLQLRTFEEFYADRHTAQLFELIVWQLVVSALHNGIRPPIPSADIVAIQKYIKASSSSSSAALLLLVHRVAESHAKWHEAKHSSDIPRSRADLYGYLQTFIQLDADLNLWETTIPRGWRCQMERNTAHARATYDPKWRDLFLNSRGSPTEIHTGVKLRRCWTWVFYRTTRILVLRDLLEILNWTFKLPPVDDFENIHHQNSPSSQSDRRTSMALDDISLQIKHGFATTQLVNMVEKSTAFIFAIFNAPVYGKIDQDLIGMRGYVMTWPLGIMDAVLKHAFVPDSGVPATPFHSSTPSPNFSDVVPPSSVSLSPYSSYAPISSRPSFTTSDSPPMPFPQGLGIAQHTNDLSDNLLLKAPTTQSPPAQSSQTSLPLSPKSKLHIYDTSPTHPFDYPMNFPSSGLSITKPARIDVAARREWLNRILYFVSTELGIKTAVAIPASEGFLEVCKKQVEELIAR